MERTISSDASKRGSPPEAPEDANSPNIEILFSLWPVASTLSQYLAVGDLITLARMSVTLRALLHGFETPGEISVPGDSGFVPVRPALNIGRHGTPYWQRLKDRSSFECSSRIHTKGPEPKPCRYCSRPICDACIVRSSFARGHENTFQNRVRHLCKECWETGNPSRTHRFPLTPTAEGSTSKMKWHDPDGSMRDYCTCTLKHDGIICLECKDLQNWEAVSSAELQCHGQDCKECLDPDDKDRRRICLWCNRALPRQIGGTTRHHWNQKMIEARARNAASRQADLEEYNRKRLKLMRMSRREMRGDESVKDDPDADLPQFVRHLDTINYRRYMPESAAPNSSAVYDSKKGYWRYNKEFLLRMKRRCAQIPPPPQLSSFQNSNVEGLRFARTNAEKADDFSALATAIPNMSTKRLARWNSRRAIILEYLLVQKLSYEATQALMREEFALNASIKEFHKVMRAWTTQEHLREHRRKSLEAEGDAASERKGPLSFGKDTPSIEGETNDDDTESSCGSTSDSTSTTTEVNEPGTAPARHPDEAETHLQCNTIQDQQSLSQAPTQASFPSAPPLPSAQAFTLPSSSTNPPLPPAAPEQPTTNADLDDLASLYLPMSILADDHQRANEEPPPYSADGWVWPEEEEQEQEHDHGQDGEEAPT